MFSLLKTLLLMDYTCLGFTVFSVYSVSTDDLTSYISYEDICQRGDRNKISSRFHHTVEYSCKKIFDQSTEVCEKSMRH